MMENRLSVAFVLRGIIHHWVQKYVYKLENNKRQSGGII